MTCVELNTDLVECFGELENLCNQIYGPIHGVSNYINEMKSRDFSGRIIVPDWDYKLNRLIEVRHKRNRLSHGEVSFREQWANKDDISFVVDFRNSILNQTDPITLCYKQISQQKSVVKNQIPQRKSLGCFTAIIIVVAVVVGVISFIM